MIQGQIVTAPDGTKGFDANRHITPELASSLHAAKYRFAARYVRRTEKHDYDLTVPEVQAILGGQLGLIIVQHVAPEGWIPSLRRSMALPRWLPSASKGVIYGQTAVDEVRALGLPPLTPVFCDLEGVDSHSSPALVITYCNNWYDVVAKAGFTPGLYVGWSPGLNGEQLYSKLRFSHYWGAYNFDVVPAKRGYQMKQFAAKKADLVPGFTNQDFDVDYTMADQLGGRVPLLTAPGWKP